MKRRLKGSIVTPSVNANSSALTTAFIRAAINRVRMNLGDEQFTSEDSKMTWYYHPAQADAYESLAINISQIFKDPSGNQGVDMMFGNQQNMTMSGIKTVQSIHQDRTRIDLLCMNYWGEAALGMTGIDLETCARCKIPIMSILSNIGAIAASLMTCC